MSDQNSTEDCTAAELRTFEAMDAVSAHVETCPRWWFLGDGHVQHCQEHDALSAVFQAEMVALLNAHRAGYTDVVGLDAAIGEFHVSWRRKYEARKPRRWWLSHQGSKATHTPYTPQYLVS